METTVYIYLTLSPQHASKIFKIGMLTKNPLGYFFFLLVQGNVCAAQWSHFGLIIWSTVAENDKKWGTKSSSCSSADP